MIHLRDHHDFARLREPSLEDYALGPAFLRGDAKHWKPFRPIGNDVVAATRQPRALVLSYAEALGILATVASLTFCLTLYWRS